MTYKSRAIVLKTKAWPRNARLYILYTQKYGKVRAVASGAQKVKSKLAGHLQHFSFVEVMIAQGKSIDRLAQARYLRGFDGITNHFSAMLYGSYLLEVLDLLTNDGVADQDIWQLVEDAFTELHDQSTWAVFDEDSSQYEASFLARLFALQLLNLFGYGPELHNCLQCRNRLAPDGLALSVVQSGLLCARCRQGAGDAETVSLNTVKILRAAQEKNLRDLAKIVVDEETREACKYSIDQMVAFQTQKPLRTASFFRPVKRRVSFV